MLYDNCIRQKIFQFSKNPIASIFRVQTETAGSPRTFVYLYQKRHHLLEDINLQKQQDRQCAHNVTLWSIRVTIVAVET
jgi:hypothetical protein